MSGLLLVATGCGPAGPGIAVQLQVIGQELSSRGGPLPSAGQPPPGMDAFRLCVQDAAGRGLVCEDFHDLTMTTVRLEGVPAGANLTVTFQGYTSDEQTQQADVLWCGRATGIEVKKNATTTVRMLLGRCGDFNQLSQPMSTGRAFHSATTLPDGKVLLVGGYQTLSVDNGRCSHPCTILQATDSIELFDPADGSFQPVGHLAHPRGLHQALALSDGRVLVVGGCQVATLQSSFDDLDRPGSPLRCLEPGPAAVTAELVEPVSATATAVDIPPVLLSAAARVGKDRLALFGGVDLQGQPLNRVLLLDVSSGALTSEQFTGALTTARAGATAVATAPADASAQEVLLVGGSEAPSPSDPGPFAEWLVVGGGGLTGREPRFVSAAAGVGLPVMHAMATLTAPGRILIAGGILPARYLSQETPFLPRPLRLAAVVAAAGDSLEMLDNDHRLGKARLFGSLVPLPGQEHTLVAGGFENLRPDRPARFEPAAAVEVWEEQAGDFALLWLRGEPVQLNQARAGHTTTALPDGTFLLCGGLNGETLLDSAEIFNPFSTSLGEGGLSPTTMP